MPIPKVNFDLNDSYHDIKTLRSSNTNKRYRRLKNFERCYYKKISEVTKVGYNLTQEHDINDGNLNFKFLNGVTYSLNKKKRWLLPDLIQRRICNNEDSDNNQTKLVKGDQTKTLEDQLKIVMYENNNINYRSTCFRYGNSKMEPRLIEPKQHQYFNSETLTKWMNFLTRTRARLRKRRRKNNNNSTEDNVDPNISNFGIQQRPGFFQAEVTYKFLYPYRPSVKFNSDNEETRCNIGTKRSGLRVCSKSRIPCLSRAYSHSFYKPVTKEKKIAMLNDIINSELLFDVYDEDDGSQKLDYTKDEEIIEDSSMSLCYPINSFIHNKRSHSSESIVTMKSLIPPDYKSNKVFGILQDSLDQDNLIVEKQPQQIVYSSSFSKLNQIIYDEQEFLNYMIQHHESIKQANIYPPTFLQQFDVDDELAQIFYIYENTSCGIYLRIDNDLKIKNSKLISDLVNQISSSIDCLPSIISSVQNFLSLLHHNNNYNVITISSKVNTMEEIIGSLRLPLSVSLQFSTLRPNSMEKEIAVKLLKTLVNDEISCFDTNIKQGDDNDCCSICLEFFSQNNRIYCVLPCQHFICAECLQNYIQISVQTFMLSSSSPSINITCFYSKCLTVLNTITLKRFLSIQLYKRLCDYSNEKRLFSSDIYRYCRSRKCLKIMIIDKEKRFDGAMCLCGERICLKCSEEWHWPAACGQYKNYLKHLKQSGDHLLTSHDLMQTTNSYVAEGKHCPTCGSFCEKNGGCMHMRCICGSEYCWTCLQCWRNHDYSKCSQTDESSYELRSSNRNRLHNLAVKHRRARNQYHIHSFLTQIYSPHCQIPTRDVQDVYNQMLALYIDINTIAEFLYVCLQQKRIQQDIRFVLGQTAKKFDAYSFRLRLYAEDYKILNQNIIKQIHQIRLQVNQSFKNLAYMKSYHNF